MTTTKAPATRKPRATKNAAAGTDMRPLLPWLADAADTLLAEAAPQAAPQAAAPVLFGPGELAQIATLPPLTLPTWDENYQRALRVACPRWTWYLANTPEHRHAQEMWQCGWCDRTFDMVTPDHEPCSQVHPLDASATPVRGPFEAAAQTVTITLPPAVAEGSGTPAPDPEPVQDTPTLGALDENAERHLAAFVAAHDEEDAPDFPAEDTPDTPGPAEASLSPEAGPGAQTGSDEDGQDGTALDQAGPLPVGDWQKSGTGGKAAE
jgi:hypothetical protein